MLKCACSRSRQFDYDCSAPEGAILVFPNGASRTDLSSNVRPRLLAYAREQALSWLEWVYGSLEHANSLYLITGCDKCRNWCLASYSNMPASTDVSLSFTPTDSQGDVVQYVAQSPGDIAMRTFRLDGQNSENQSVLVRGYRISAGGTVKKSDVMPPQEMARDKRISKSIGFSQKGSKIQPIDTLDDLVESFPGLPKVRFLLTIIQRLPERCQVHHPSDIINSYMLLWAVRIPSFVRHSQTDLSCNKDPHAQIAITHDDDWCSVMEGVVRLVAHSSAHRSHRDHPSD